MAASTAPLAPGLARKVKKVIETRTETPETLGALSSLSDFFDDNSAIARRQLRNTVEQRGLSFNGQFLEALKSVLEALETFLEQYQLSPAELNALKGDTISPSFFEALARVGSIHANCRRLLRTHHQRAGLELMDSMSAHQEAAYERLCRWVQGECRNLGDMDAPEVNTLLQSAAEALRERPVLFKYCAEEVTAARHGALFSRFVTALTRGGPGGLPRPIEVQAHDPRRYIGDMLAWVHQALASERELFVALFGAEGLPELPTAGAASRSALMPTSSNASSVGALRATESSGLGDMPDTAAMLDRVFESICRPLKVRIEQVLLGAQPLLLCFSLTQLIGFYATTVTRLLGRSSQLAATLGACRALAARAFADHLKARGDRLLRHPPPPPADLAPPPQVLEGVKQLSEIITSFEAAFDTAGGGTGEEEFAPVLAAVVDPLLTACERSAEALSPDAPTRVDEHASVDPTARHSYLINCYSHLADVLAKHPCCASRSAALREAIEGYLAALVGSTAGALLARCSLGEAAERVRLYSGDGTHAGAGVMAADPALSVVRMAGGLRSCYVLISQPDVLPEMRALQIPRLRSRAVEHVAHSLSEAYATVYAAMADPQNGYVSEPIAAEALQHTPAQVRTILGIS
ncbi:hypothetical protein WJX73_004685 [Symbiochloris irregularis]|uniref:Conserved oligomeric Golgi complex subunit 6 n=1 Tax=Symbiochloris irregularis TaxID=706552 RepID=A0AAW1NQD2_9CHLO